MTKNNKGMNYMIINFQIKIILFHIKRTLKVEEMIITNIIFKKIAKRIKIIYNKTSLL